METTGRPGGRWQNDRPMTGPDVEDAIMRVLDEMEDVAVQYAEAVKDAAMASTDYRREKARLMLTSGHRTDAMREAYAIHNAGELLEARDMTRAPTACDSTSRILARA